MLKVAIAGGNITGSTVVSMLRDDPDVKIVGIFEKNPETPGVVLARKWGIPLYDDITALTEAVRPEIILNFTDDRGLEKTIERLSTNTEVINASGSRFMWKVIEKQKKAMLELHKTIEDEKKILSLIDDISCTGRVTDFIGFILEKAMEITDSPAGCFSVLEQDSLKLVASKGLSKKFTEGNKGGIPSDLLIKKMDTLTIGDVTKTEYRDNPELAAEGIKAILVCPVHPDPQVWCVLYLYDFKQRHFSERQKRAVRIVTGIVSLALSREEILQRSIGHEFTFTGLSEKTGREIIERSEELERMNMELERANQLKNSFIANMSHELRTPLNSIIGFSNVLIEKTFGELTEYQERYIRNIHTSGSHLLDLINNMLDIAKIESGKYDMSYETFDVEEVLSEVYNIIKPLTDKKTIDLSLNIAKDLGPVTADRVKLKQIFYNLLSNAIKFTPEGGKIGINVWRTGLEEQSSTGVDFIKFSVWDTGVGISSDDIDRIFDEFEQVDTSFSRKYGGAGLGLALTKKLVELHGGHVAVESKLGSGSTFTFYVPFASPLPDKEQQITEVEAVRLNFPWMKDKAPLILVVEDDIPSAELLTIHLSQAGYKVAHAFDGEDAILKARAMKPFAILLDIMLPKKDGWEVLQTLKSDEKTANIPVLIHSIIDNKDLAFALGAADYLLKPLDKFSLLEKLHGLSTTKAKKGLSTILVVESNVDVEALKESLNPKEFLVYSAKSGKRGLELAIALKPDIILLDFELPDMLGFDVIKELKENSTTRDIPIFILTEKDVSVSDRIDLVGKIERIIRKHKFDLNELLDYMREIEILYPKRAGLVDDLTGVFSHRYFQIRLAQEIFRAVRYKLPMNLMIIDVDFFNQYVLNNGEENSNYVIKNIAEILKKNIRGSDVVVRYGADSFAIILPNTVLSAALSLGNRFNAIIRNFPFVHGETQPKKKITASVGLAFLDSQSPEEIILCCDKALALAISKGGDRVELYSKEMDEEAGVAHSEAGFSKKEE